MAHLREKLENSRLTHCDVLFVVLLAANQVGDVGIDLGSEGSALEFDPMLDFFIRVGFPEVASHGYRAFLKGVFGHFVSADRNFRLSGDSTVEKRRRKRARVI